MRGKFSKKICAMKKKCLIMEVMHKVSAVEVIITPDPIKLIKPQLNIIQGWRKRVVESCSSPSESFSLMRLEGRNTK